MPSLKFTGISLSCAFSSYFRSQLIFLFTSAQTSTMGFLEDYLYWQDTKADGTKRSFLAKFLDPVGACIEPTDLSPFTAEDDIAAEVPVSDVGVDVTESTPAPVADTPEEQVQAAA